MWTHLNENEKILVLGPGPIIIGQGAEFDYAGVQCLKAIKENNFKAIVLNPNPASIMTNPELSEKVYFEPLTIESVIKIIKENKISAVMYTFAGQVGLNLICEINQLQIDQKYNLKLLGPSIQSITDAENRSAFKEKMSEININTVKSFICTQIEQASIILDSLSPPYSIRPSKTLGGLGGKFASDKASAIFAIENALKDSPINEVIIEESLFGLLEVEYEMIRDHNDNTIAICNMENIDPVGVHTGDSIVVSPIITLNNKEIQNLRNCAKKILNHLKIIGACNVQFAYDRSQEKIFVIEINPRLSRSSALASKATCYPIAYISTLIYLGKNLNEIRNPITKATFASFEPSLDYFVVKTPKFSFEKFFNIDQTLGFQMKATGESYAISDNFLIALIKSYQMSNNFLITSKKLRMKYSSIKSEELIKKSKNMLHDRIELILEIIRRADDQLITISNFYLDPFYVNQFKEFFKLSNDNQIRLIYGNDKLNKIDSCSGEFASNSSTYYFNQSNFCELDSEQKNNLKEQKHILIIGPGAIKIGQGIEFDLSCTSICQKLKEHNIKTIILNNNPSTTSTDMNIADYLIIDQININIVKKIYKKFNCLGVFVQFGGQTAINLAKDIFTHNKAFPKEAIKIIDLKEETLINTEDRLLFNQFCQENYLDFPRGILVNNQIELLEKISQLNFPLIYRPSFVTGGDKMTVINSHQELIEFQMKNKINYPAFFDEYIDGEEFECDLLGDGDNFLVPCLIKHIEEAGIHSGDSHLLFPATFKNSSYKKDLLQKLKLINFKFKHKGLLNIQFIIKKNKIYFLEINARASRTIPLYLKALNFDILKYTANILINENLIDIKLNNGFYYYQTNNLSLKVPIFSQKKLIGVTPTLGPNMKSTGETLINSNHSNLEQLKALSFYYQNNYWLKDIKHIFIVYNKNLIKPKLEKLINLINNLKIKYTLLEKLNEEIIYKNNQSCNLLIYNFFDGQSFTPNKILNIKILSSFNLALFQFEVQQKIKPQIKEIKYAKNISSN